MDNLHQPQCPSNKDIQRNSSQLPHDHLDGGTGLNKVGWSSCTIIAIIKCATIKEKCYSFKFSHELEEERKEGLGEETMVNAKEKTLLKEKTHSHIPGRDQNYITR